MSSRMLIFGSRTFSDKQFLFDTMDMFIKAGVGPELVIEGEATGADTLGREWAESHGLPVLKFPADWDKYKRSAGPIRNRQMIVEGRPTWACGFVDKPIESSRGSLNMRNQLLRASIPVEIFRPGFTSWP